MAARKERVPDLPPMWRDAVASRLMYGLNIGGARAQAGSPGASRSRNRSPTRTKP